MTDFGFFKEWINVELMYFNMSYHPSFERVYMLKKYMFVLHTKYMQQKINGCTSFVIDNMYYVSFRI